MAGDPLTHDMSFSDLIDDFLNDSGMECHSPIPKESQVVPSNDLTAPLKGILGNTNAVQQDKVLEKCSNPLGSGNKSSHFKQSSICDFVAKSKKRHDDESSHKHDDKENAKKNLQDVRPKTMKQNGSFEVSKVPLKPGNMKTAGKTRSDDGVSASDSHKRIGNHQDNISNKDRTAQSKDDISTMLTKIKISGQDHKTAKLVVPPIKVAPTLEPITNWDHVQYVFFDLETTSLHLTCDIIQIAAVCGDEEFEAYITPSKHISWKASKVTGLTKRKGVLRYKRKPVKTCTPFFTINAFIRWLDNFAPCVLVGHNCRSFDSKRLVKFATKYSLGSKLAQATLGFVDTLPIFRSAYPDFHVHKLEYLFHRLLPGNFESHNALEDTKALKKLFDITEVSEDGIMTSSFSYLSLVELTSFVEEGHKNLETYGDWISDYAITDTMAEKAAQSGLRAEHLKQSFYRSGKEGLTELLSEKTMEGKPRVTKSSSVIDKICSYLSSEDNKN